MGGLVMKAYDDSCFQNRCGAPDTGTPSILCGSLEETQMVAELEDPVDLERQRGTCALGQPVLQTQDVQVHDMAGRSQLLHLV